MAAAVALCWLMVSIPSALGCCWVSGECRRACLGFLGCPWALVPSNRSLVPVCARARSGCGHSNPEYAKGGDENSVLPAWVPLCPPVLGICFSFPSAFSPLVPLFVFLVSSSCVLWHTPHPVGWPPACRTEVEEAAPPNYFSSRALPFLGGKMTTRGGGDIYKSNCHSQSSELLVGTILLFRALLWG